MNVSQRLGVGALAAIALTGIGFGLVISHLLSDSGRPPLMLPVSLPASVFLLAAILVYLAARLKKQLQPESGKPVNPFHAVRLLAAARAAQITGALFAGFGAGLLIALLARPVGVMVSVWLPMLLTAITAAALLAAGKWAESVCRIPPPEEPERAKTEPGAEIA